MIASTYCCNPSPDHVGIANNGICVSTIDLSADDEAYLVKVKQSVALVDGTELVRLMIWHGVDVQHRVSDVIH